MAKRLSRFLAANYHERNKHLCYQACATGNAEHSTDNLTVLLNTALVLCLTKFSDNSIGSAREVQRVAKSRLLFRKLETDVSP